MTRTAEQRIALGDWAKNLLDNENFVAVCNGMVADSLAELMRAKPGSEEATLSHMRLLAANDFKSALSVLVNDAAMARNEVKKRR